jgi:pimeloyl-ACP methyl ester carboxylesterase
MTRTNPRRLWTRPSHRLIPSLVGLIAFVILAVPADQHSAGAQTGGPKPTVVLVHGSFADASGWGGVIERLQRDGYPVLAPANPLRTLSGDAEYVASVLDTIPGPVVLVGHSYGGAVITNAATGKSNVKALVYIAAFAPDKGETVFGILGSFPGSKLPLALKLRPYHRPDGSVGFDGYIDPAQFHDVFAADVPATTAAVMAVSQRPGSLDTGLEPSRDPAWKTIPSWYLVAKSDHTIPPDAERFMARRAGSQTVEIESSHVAMISNPDAATDLIRAAAATVR